MKQNKLYIPETETKKIIVKLNKAIRNLEKNHFYKLCVALKDIETAQKLAIQSFHKSSHRQKMEKENEEAEEISKIFEGERDIRICRY